MASNYNYKISFQNFKGSFPEEVREKLKTLTKLVASGKHVSPQVLSFRRFTMHSFPLQHAKLIKRFLIGIKVLISTYAPYLRKYSQVMH